MAFAARLAPDVLDMGCGIQELAFGQSGQWCGLVVLELLLMARLCVGILSWPSGLPECGHEAEYNEQAGDGQAGGDTGRVHNGIDGCWGVRGFTLTWLAIRNPARVSDKAVLM